jgi:hypothetical protein
MLRFSLSRPIHRLVDDGNCLNLDQRLRRIQGRNPDDRVGRIRSDEIATPKLDDLRKVRHVPEEDRHLDDVRKARSASTENPFDVREDLLSFRIEIAEADELSGPIDRRLARDEEKVAGAIALREAEGLVRIRSRFSLPSYAFLHKLGVLSDA